jgi:hypothetical protein
MCTAPRHELPEREGLRHAVVGADFQRSYSATFLHALRDHDQGSVRGQPSAGLQRFAAKQGEIEQDKIDTANPVERRRLSGHHLSLESVTMEERLHLRRQVEIVLDDEDPGARIRCPRTRGFSLLALEPPGSPAWRKPRRR